MVHMSMNYPVRRVSDLVLVCLVVFATLGITASNAFMFSQPESFVWEWQSASGGWINANLILFAPLTIGFVVLALVWGRLGWRDLGFASGFVRDLVLFLVIGWTAVQLLAVAAALAFGGSLTFASGWSEHGAGAMLGFLIAMVLGTALFEDLVFRAFLIPQSYLRVAPGVRGHAAAMIATLFVCAVIFALWHLPTILLNRDAGLAGSLGLLAYMMLGGVMLGLVFVRTGSLALAIGTHALVNAPTLIVDAPVSGSALAGVVGVMVIAMGPRLVGRSGPGWFIRPEQISDQKS